MIAISYNNQFPIVPDNCWWLKKLHLHPCGSFLGGGCYKIPSELMSGCIKASKLILRLPMGFTQTKGIPNVFVNNSNLVKFFYTLTSWGIIMSRFKDFQELTKALLSSINSLRVVIVNIYCSTIYQNWRARNAKNTVAHMKLPSTWKL